MPPRPAGPVASQPAGGGFDLFHAVLDGVGMLPVIGTGADLLNAAVYAAEGDWTNAGLSAASAIPLAGDALGAAKTALKYGDDAIDVATTVVAHADEAAAAVTTAFKGGDDLAAGAIAYGDDVGDAAVAACHSFAPDTAVLTAAGAIPIADIEPGDEVIATDPATGETGPYAVTATFAHRDPVSLTVSIDGERIVTTPGHPFMTTRGWTEAQDLVPGDEVLRRDGGTGTIVALTWDRTPAVRHDLTVETAHTFFVGEGAWWVHNCDEALLGLSESHVTESGDAVIGHFPGYVDKATERGASYFDIGDAWDTLDDAGRWGANSHFLDVVASRGDRVLLSTPKGDIRPASWTAREVDYLTEQLGYKWVNQWALKPGG